MALRVFLVSILLQISACSTIGTLATRESGSGKDIVYSGVKIDWYILSAPMETGDSIHIGKGVFILYPFVIVDLLFSAIADTMVLPYTISERKNIDTSEK